MTQRAFECNFKTLLCVDIISESLTKDKGIKNHKRKLNEPGVSWAESPVFFVASFKGVFSTFFFSAFPPFSFFAAGVIWVAFSTFFATGVSEFLGFFVSVGVFSFCPGVFFGDLFSLVLSFGVSGAFFFGITSSSSLLLSSSSSSSSSSSDSSS